jgi:hypothetical protein
MAEYQCGIDDVLGRDGPLVEWPALHPQEVAPCHLLTARIFVTAKLAC